MYWPQPLRLNGQQDMSFSGARAEHGSVQTTQAGHINAFNIKRVAVRWQLTALTDEYLCSNMLLHFLWTW
jgi:hypothetical protein